MGIGSTLIVLVIAASAVAMIVRRLKLPYTVALVLAGLAIGVATKSFPALSDINDLHLTKELLFSIFLPALLFEAAFHINWRDFRANARAILLLAVPGVAAAIAIAGLLVALIEPWVGVELPLMVAFLFVAMCAATDPVSVIALFKELGVPKRLSTLMEGESLLNDGVGVVVFFAIAAALGVHDTHEPVTGAWLVKFIVWEVGVGIGIGVGCGLLVSYITTLVDDHLVEIMLTTIAAFGSYVLADALHASFVLAVVAAGMSCGNVGARYGMTATNRIAVESFWEYLVFAANSFVFLLVGKEIDLERLLGHAWPILIAWTVLMFARALVIGGVSQALARTTERLPKRWATVLIWGGLRGSLSMVLALSLPSVIEYDGHVIRTDLLVDLTFGVVLISILAQGLTMAPVLRWSGAIGVATQRRAYMRLRGALRATHAALRGLDESISRGEIHQSTFETLRGRLSGRLARIEAAIDEFAPEVSDIHDQEVEHTRQRLLDVERAAVRKTEKAGIISPEVARDLLKEIAGRSLQPDGDLAADDNADDAPSS